MPSDLISTLVASFQLIEMAKAFKAAVNAASSVSHELLEYELDGSSFGTVPNMLSILDNQMSACHFGCVGAAM